MATKKNPPETRAKVSLSAPDPKIKNEEVRRGERRIALCNGPLLEVNSEFRVQTFYYFLEAGISSASREAHMRCF